MRSSLQITTFHPFKNDLIILTSRVSYSFLFLSLSHKTDCPPCSPMIVQEAILNVSVFSRFWVSYKNLRAAQSQMTNCPLPSSLSPLRFFMLIKICWVTLVRNRWYSESCFASIPPMSPALFLLKVYLSLFLFAYHTVSAFFQELLFGLYWHTSPIQPTLCCQGSVNDCMSHKRDVHSLSDS